MKDHGVKCRKFRLARKFDLVHKTCHSPDYFSPPEYHMEYTDPDEPTGVFCKTTFPMKKILIVKFCPFCGKKL